MVVCGMLDGAGMMDGAECAATAGARQIHGTALKPVAYVPMSWARHRAEQSARSGRIMNPWIYARPRAARALLPALAALLAACSATADGSPSASAIGSQLPAESTPAQATDQPTTAPTATATATVDVTEVTINGFSFGPAKVSVKVGDVTFANTDEFSHTVTEGENGAAAADARFDEVVGVGKSAVITFADPGDYQITCQFHPLMRLLVRAH